jgi:hypothetical protein
VIGVCPGGIKTNLFEGHQPEDFNDFLTPEFVAQKVVENIEKDSPELEQVLKRE